MAQKKETPKKREPLKFQIKSLSYSRTVQVDKFEPETIGFEVAIHEDNDASIDDIIEHCQMVVLRNCSLTPAKRQIIEQTHRARLRQANQGKHATGISASEVSTD